MEWNVALTWTDVDMWTVHSHGTRNTQQGLGTIWQLPENKLLCIAHGAWLTAICIVVALQQPGTYLVWFFQSRN